MNARNLLALGVQIRNDLAQGTRWLLRQSWSEHTAQYVGS